MTRGSQPTIEGAFGDLHRSGAATGFALTTTANAVGFPVGTDWIAVTPRNFSTAVVALVHPCPWLTILKTQDIAVTFTDYSQEAQDARTDTSVTLNDQDTLANGDALYIGSHDRFRGAHIDVDGANGNASTLTVAYFDHTRTWTSISATDGTTSGGASLAIDGVVTWTVPASALWPKRTLNDILTLTRTTPEFTTPMYWTRWVFSAALDAAVTLDHVIALNKLNLPVPLGSGQTLSFQVGRGFGGLGGIQGETDAGTGNLMVICAAAHDGLFPMA